MSILEAYDLYRFYHAGQEETLALKGVGIHADTGEMIAVMGPSGSGKSTLFACLSGLDEPDGGYVKIDGERLTRRPEVERATIRARRIGIMLQSGNLFNHLSVEDNIRLPMKLAAKTDEKHLNDLLNQVGLSDRRYARPNQISGGEAARAGLAVALATKPQVVLADEPTGEVDAETEKGILQLLDSYRKNGGTLLIATHSEGLAAQADRVIRLYDGKVVHDGDAR